jgi:4a-hydroxytetrahydrobiopterin dehydratase
MKLFSEHDNALVTELEFEDFVQAFQFMTLVAELAEAQQHHPEWTNVYNKVSIRLTTHDSGNQITDQDRQLAEAIETSAAIQSLGARVL